MMWTYADLYTARVHKLHQPDRAAHVFNTAWLQFHLPEQRVQMITANEKAWLCRQICVTCRLARLSCPECHMK
eukprot:8047396-Heterocapsa_arctica.AAC.1